MLPQPDPPSKSLFKTSSFYSWSLVAVVALVVGWIFFSRWWQNRAFEHRFRQERTEKQREDDLSTLEQMGGKQLAIQTFYATPGEMRRETRASAMYSTSSPQSRKNESRGPN